MTHPTYHMPQPAAMTEPLSVMVKPYHMEALDRIAAASPGVETRSAAIRMLIEQADRALAAEA